MTNGISTSPKTSVTFSSKRYIDGLFESVRSDRISERWHIRVKRLAIFMFEGFVAHRQINDTFYQGNDRWNERPAKYEIENALTWPVEIKL